MGSEMCIRDRFREFISFWGFDILCIGDTWPCMRLMTELFDGVKPDDGRKRSRDLPRKTSAADIYEDAGATSSALWTQEIAKDPAARQSSDTVRH